MNVETIDLMGPLLDRMTDQFAVNPSEQPGLFRVLNESYFRRIETMQFAFNHDDGKRVEELQKAEIILLGVSRTFKTPLSIYLAFKRWFVANVPIVLGIPAPETYSVPPERVFCLMTYPNRLAQLRKARQDRLGGTPFDYANPDYVRRECTYASQVFSSQPKWQQHQCDKQIHRGDSLGDHRPAAEEDGRCRGGDWLAVGSRQSAVSRLYTRSLQLFLYETLTYLQRSGTRGLDLLKTLSYNTERLPQNAIKAMSENRIAGLQI